MEDALEQIGKIDCLTRWIRLRQEGVTLEKLLDQCGYNCIALYGKDNVTECIFHELKCSKIEVITFIMKNKNVISTSYPIVDADHIPWERIDAILTVTYEDYMNLKREVSIPQNMKCITLGEVLYEL